MAIKKKVDAVVKGATKLASKFKSDLRQQYKDSMSYPDAGEIASLKRRGGDSPSKSINNAFDYIEKSKTSAQAKSRSEEMFGEFDLDTAIEEAGGFDKAFKIKPVKKAMGGMMKKKGYAKGGAVSRKQSKPKGVGVAARGYGRAMR